MGPVRMSTPSLVGRARREGRGGLCLGGHQGILVFGEGDRDRAWEKGFMGKPRAVNEILRAW